MAKISDRLERARAASSLQLVEDSIRKAASCLSSEELRQQVLVLLEPVPAELPRPQSGSVDLVVEVEEVASFQPGSAAE